MKKWIMLLCLTLSSSVASATVYPGFRQVITDSSALNAETNFTRPGYHVWKTDNTHNTSVSRITGDQGTPFSFTKQGAGSGTWSQYPRHHYSKDQPWGDAWIKPNG